MPVRYKEPARVYNRCYVSKFGTEKNGYILKVVTMKSVRNKLADVPNEDIEFAHYDSKLEQSIARARSRIWEYAMCNDWDWFFTATLDPAKYDRYNLDKFHKDITDWFYDLSRYNKRYGKIDFLLIPERHKNGAWHLHGLLSGLHTSVLHRFKIGDRMSSEIARLVRSGRNIYNWKAYQDKFGFCTLERVNNRQAVAKYITKYITKDVSETVTDLNAHMFYHSRPLNTAEKIKEGFMLCDINPLDLPEYKPSRQYETEYCVISEFPYSAEFCSLLNSAIV